MSKYINESLPESQRVGQIGVNNQGEKITIIRYGRLNNQRQKTIDIQFDNGDIVKNRYYNDFRKGKVKRPTKNRIGETNINNQGLKMTIITYRRADDIDIQFEDGIIVYNKRYSEFKRGNIAHKIKNGKSFGERVMGNILNELNIRFIPQYSPYYFNNFCHVDFLLIDYNIILEIDGERGNHNREYDYWRDFLNMKYGGYKTIRIDYKYKKNPFEYIKKQILNCIFFIENFDIYNINWDKIYIDSLYNLQIEIEKYCIENSNFEVKDIEYNFNIPYHTALNCINRSKKMGRIKYKNPSEKRIDKKNEVKYLWMNGYGVCDISKKMNISISNTKSLLKELKNEGKISDYNEFESRSRGNKSYHNNRTTFYKIVDNLGNISTKQTGEIFNNNNKGFLNINKKTFDKYFPNGKIDVKKITVINENYKTKELIKRIEPFDGWQIIKIEKEDAIRYE